MASNSKNEFLFVLPPDECLLQPVPKKIKLKETGRGQVALLLYNSIILFLNTIYTNCKAKVKSQPRKRRYKIFSYQILKKAKADTKSMDFSTKVVHLAISFIHSTLNSHKVLSVEYSRDN